MLGKRLADATVVGMGFALSLASAAVGAQTNAPAAAKTAISITEIATNLQNPWGLQFLPDGRFLVTERAGYLRIVRKDGTKSQPITGVPEVVAWGQGGLLDVLLAQDFQTSGLIYISYAEPRGLLKNGTTVARAKLTVTDNGGSLSDLTLIFQQDPPIRSLHHFGSRLVWAKDGTLFITTGERATESESAQDLTTHLGKVIRINADGSLPKDNPFYEMSSKRNEIWSYGHRNLQGAALNPATGELWTTEHGAQGGDELNIARAGKNYGWPVITWGINYDGSKIGEGTTKDGMEQPVYYWKPSIGTSGLAFYSGELFKNWKGNLLAGGLSGGVLERLVLEGNQVVGVEHLLLNRNERMRDVRVGPDGAVYVLTDAPSGKLLRLTPSP